MSDNDDKVLRALRIFAQDARGSSNYRNQLQDELAAAMARDDVKAFMRSQGRTPRKPLKDLALDADGLAAIPEPQPLVSGWLQLDSLAWASGPPGSAKTFAAVDLACCVSSGTPWHGYPVTQVPVLYVVAESPSGFKKRVPAWRASVNFHPELDNITFLPHAVQILDPGDMVELTELAVELGAGLIVFDTQSRCAVGAGENDSSEMSVLADALDKLRAATGACVLTVHHTPRNGVNLRGSNSQEGAATTILAVSKAGTCVTVSAQPEHGGKQKDTAELPPLKLEMAQFGNSAALREPPDGAVNPSETAVLDVLANDGKTSKSQLAALTGLTDRTIYTVVNKLVADGKVTVSDVGRSKYVDLVQKSGTAGD